VVREMGGAVGPCVVVVVINVVGAGAKRDRVVQERGRRHVLCVSVRARQMHQRARSGASHGCKWGQHGILNRIYVNRSAREFPARGVGGACIVHWSLVTVTRVKRTGPAPDKQVVLGGREG